MMEDPNILDLDYAVFSQIQSILENRNTMQSFLEVLPQDCTCETALISIEVESKKYNMTPAKALLTFLGSKGFKVSNFSEWFQAIGLEKALILLKKEEPIRIVEQPQRQVRVNEGDEILLSCTAVSYPPPEYEWYKEDKFLLQIDPVLSIKSARLEDSGIYTCLVTKWNEKKNAYEWLYSDICNVEVIPQDLHAVFSHESSKTFLSNSASTTERIPSLKILNQDKEVSSHQGKSVSQPVLVHKLQTSESSQKEVILITKHPYVHGKIAQGMSLCLSCEAVSSSSLPLNYQWFKNGRPLQGETASQLVLNNLYPDPDTDDKMWNYQCEVYNELDRAFSQIAVVELDETNDTTPYIATQKYAFMVANDTYDHLEHLGKPAADIRDLANILSSMGFKIFAFRNLTLTEMRNAFTSYCKMLTPGSYALFFFAGHGFELYGQTYLQPVDSSDSHLQYESVCSEYILQCMQERKPAMNILLIDACRKLPPNLSGNSESQYIILPGKIFHAKMKSNTIYGYSTSFLCASHESDDETNSIFVKYLKKYITHNRCIQDILIMVQNDFARDPVARKVQFPVIKSTLAERRKLNDPIQDTCTSIVLSDIMQWCDIKREVLRKSFEISKMKASIIIEFHHHLEVFCNGMDVYIYLHVEPDAQIFLLFDMEINVTFISPVLNIIPVHGVVLKDVNLLMGRKNFLFKKEIFNVQKINTEQLEGIISLKFLSKNVTKNIDFKADIVKISKLELSVNHLASSNVEEPLLYKNCTRITNSFS